jgi:hypothetical protein
MTLLSRKSRRQIASHIRRQRSVGEINIVLDHCVVCGSTYKLLQHHEPPLARGGKVKITICAKCSHKRHHGTRKEREELIEKITREIKKRQ